MTEELLVPRLAVGSWPRNSGFGCIMNLKSFERGDDYINDRPSGFSATIQDMLIRFNDMMCTHLTRVPVNSGVGMRAFKSYAEVLCPSCTMKLLDLANMVDGSDQITWNGMDRLFLSVMYADLNADLSHALTEYTQTADRVRFVAMNAKICHRYIDRLITFYRPYVDKTGDVDVATQQRSIRKMNSSTPVEEVNVKSTISVLADELHKMSETIKESMDKLQMISPSKLKLDWSKGHMGSCSLSCTKTHTKSELLADKIKVPLTA